MPEPIPYPAADSVLPSAGREPSVPDPRVTTDGEAATLPAVPPSGAGRYALGEEIARGGIGVVYRASDTALGREVAVKLLQDRFVPDSDTARRFADEARITGQLQHPGIPPVHDLGTLSDGRPFLAMKFIKGQTLAELLAARPDPAAERGRFVAVFEQVCQAMAYAHAHQVIHRDLKPANVMVGAFGEVQVMDWGLAKVLGAPPGDAADPEATTAGTEVRSLRDSDGLFTQTGSVLGTPAFMPPEQAVGAVGKVDQRSDVFGLGAILAVILTGQPPFFAASAETTRVEAALGKVDDCFVRLDGCGADPELIALCKRCLAPERGERPGDAGEVARAVAELRAAADERARRAELDKVRVEGEKAAAEARSLERRKRRRLWLGAAVALVVAALGGLGAVLAVQRQANAELADEQTKVQARFELARKAIATFHTGVSEDVLLKNDQFTELRTRLLKEAAGFYGDLEKLLEGQTDGKSRRLLAAGYFQLGELTEKIGSQAEALAVHRKALAVRRELAAQPGADVETRLDVARSLRMVGRLLDATGDQAEALAVHEEQRDIAAALERESPTDAVRAVLAMSHNNIGILLARTAKPGEALAAYETARDIQQKLAEANPADTQLQSDLAETHQNIGILLSQTGKPGEALKPHETARAIRQKLAEANPADTQLQSDLAESYDNIGIVLSQTGTPEETLLAYEKARAIQQKLADANPAVTRFQKNLAGSHNAIGDFLARRRLWEEAAASYRQARAIHQKLANDNPTVTQYQRNLASSLSRLGIVQRRGGRPAEAAASFRKAIGIMERLPTLTPGNHYDLACYHALLAQVAADSGSGMTAAEGQAAADKAMAELRRTVAAGFRMVAHMRVDTDLDALRPRADFQQFMKELEANAAASHPKPATPPLKP
jgi:tetratricopeptide (TPR) repeat protein